MATRKAPQQIKKEILDFLFEGPKGVNEIATKINSNWPTTNSYLEKLKEEGAVNEILITDKMKVYRRTDDPVYYSIPFSKDIRMKTLYILKEIEQKWKKEKMTKLSKTALQKIGVDVIKSCKLDLPVLNFHYGMTTCASFDSNNQSILSLIEEPEDKSEIINCIKKIFENKEHTGIAHEEKEYQYKKENMTFYSSKEKLTRLFLFLNKNKSANREVNLEIQKALLDLSLNFPLKLEKFYLDFENFTSNAQITLLNPDNSIQNLEIIKRTLDQLWDKLTTFTLFNDSEYFIDKEKKQLFEQIRELNLNFKEMDYKGYIEELESAAQETNPFEIKIPQDDSSKDIQKLILEGLENE